MDAIHAAALEARGILQTAQMLGVESSDKLGGSIRIPYFRAGVPVGAKYRTLSGDKKFCQDEGSEQCLWNIDVLDQEGPLIVAEGELDAMSAMASGYHKVVSVPNGAPAERVEGETVKYGYLNEPALNKQKEIILCADGDTQGANLLHDLSIRLGRGRCKFVRYPKECKDLNDALVRYGAAGVTATIDRALWLKVDGIYRMSELPPVPEKTPYSIDMPPFDDHYNMRMGDLCVVTGIPGHGKTTWVNDVCGRVAKKHGWTICLASFEMDPRRDAQRTLRTVYSGKLVKDMTEAEKDAADIWVDEHFSFVKPDEDDDVTLQWFLERASASVLQHGAKVVVVDPWNEMDHTRPRGMSLTEYTGFAIKQFRKFAAKYHVHMIVVAHPTKLARVDGKTPIPGLYDISDSAHWYNKPDVGIVIHRENETETLVIVAKSRYHAEIGKPATIRMNFDPDSGRYIFRDM
jgi:twinkle protein